VISSSGEHGREARGREGGDDAARLRLGNHENSRSLGPTSYFIITLMFTAQPRNRDTCHK